MPHVFIEYSANIELDIAPARLVEIAHSAVAADPAFNRRDVRTRAIRHEHFRIGDGDPDYAFVAVTIRIAPGRDAVTRKKLSEQVAAKIGEALGDAFERRGLALSVEIAEIDLAGLTRNNDIHAPRCANPAASA